jgi:hypothetical protein
MSPIQQIEPPSCQGTAVTWRDELCRPYREQAISFGVKSPRQLAVQ